MDPSWPCRSKREKGDEGDRKYKLIRIEIHTPTSRECAKGLRQRCCRFKRWRDLSEVGTLADPQQKKEKHANGRAKDG